MARIAKERIIGARANIMNTPGQSHSPNEEALRGEDAWMIGRQTCCATIVID